MGAWSLSILSDTLASFVLVNGLNSSQAFAGFVHVDNEYMFFTIGLLRALKAPTDGELNELASGNAPRSPCLSATPACTYNRGAIVVVK